MQRIVMVILFIMLISSIAIGWQDGPPSFSPKEKDSLKAMLTDKAKLISKINADYQELMLKQNDIDLEWATFAKKNNIRKDVWELNEDSEHNPMIEAIKRK